MVVALSPYRQGKARDSYNIFCVFNALSWQFLTGNLITLFALRMGANSTYIGTLSAILYVAFFFLPLGKIFARRFSMVTIFSSAWIGRALGMIPLLFAPFFFNAGRQDLALLLMLIGVSLFHVIRGVGMIANNPILSFLSAGADRGSYLTQVQIINSAVGMFAGFLIAMVLGGDPPLFLFALIVAVGIGCGITSSILMRKIPGPDMEEGEKGEKLLAVFRQALTQPPLRQFLFILLLIGMVSGVSRIFVVVYSREVLGQSDGMVSLFAVFGGLGALSIGLLAKFLVDRIGAKPIFSFCVILGVLSMIPIIFIPVSLKYNFNTLILFLAFLFFLLSFSWVGAEGIMQTYFMGLVPAEKMTDMGILYYFVFGVAGVAGSLMGGVILDVTTLISGSVSLSFRALYFILAVIAITAFINMRKLVSLGALPFMGALEVMFSYRDLKAISLLDKLSKSSDSNTEEALLGALQDVPSRLAIKGLLSRIKSPRLAVRMESIRAIDALDGFNEDVEKALMEDIRHNPYTTAYRSARTLGNHGVFPALNLLREMPGSNDYMLAGEAMIALAKLGDTDSRPLIEQMVLNTQNPRLKIAGMEALGIFGSPESLSVLLETLIVANPPPYLRDEAVMAIASILDIQNKFYSLLVRYLADQSLLVTLAMDEAESVYEYYHSVHGRKRNKKDPALAALSHQAKTFQSAVSEYIRHSNGSRLCRWIKELPEELVHGSVQVILSEAVLDAELIKHPRLRLLIVHWAAHELRLWTNRLKEK